MTTDQVYPCVYYPKIGQRQEGGFRQSFCYPKIGQGNTKVIRYKVGFNLRVVASLSPTYPNIGIVLRQQ